MTTDTLCLQILFCADEAAMTGKGPVCVQYRQRSFAGIFLVPSWLNPLRCKDEENVINETVAWNQWGDALPWGPSGGNFVLLL